MADESGPPQLPDGSRALILSEANMMFETYLDVINRVDPGNQPNALLIKAKEYAAKFANISNKATVQKIREMLAERGLEEFELAQLASLSPGDVDEARALVPSLEDKTRYSDEDLNHMLQELSAYVNIQ